MNPFSVSDTDTFQFRDDVVDYCKESCATWLRLSRDQVGCALCERISMGPAGPLPNVPVRQVHEASEVTSTTSELQVAKYILKIKMQRGWKFGAHGAMQHGLGC